jgi:hypothetical protein
MKSGSFKEGKLSLQRHGLTIYTKTNGSWNILKINAREFYHPPMMKYQHNIHSRGWKKIANAKCRREASALDN